MRAFGPALGAGIVFGAGLALSDMVNPARVLGFLDIVGSWDATLAFVMGGAVIASAVGFLLSRRLRAPVFGKSFVIPDNRQLDRNLIGGAALFDAGWGLVGFCPGPAIASLVLGMWQPWLFAGAMIAGMFLHRTFAERAAGRLELAR